MAIDTQELKQDLAFSFRPRNWHDVAEHMFPNADWRTTAEVSLVLAQFMHHIALNDLPEKPVDVFEHHASALVDIAQTLIHGVIHLEDIPEIDNISSPTS